MDENQGKSHPTEFKSLNLNYKSGQWVIKICLLSGSIKMNYPNMALKLAQIYIIRNNYKY